MSAPDKQKQNASEQKVNYLKHRVDYTLFVSLAQILFWCHCMKFVVYYLNLTAWSRLNYPLIGINFGDYSPPKIVIYILD